MRSLVAIVAVVWSLGCHKTRSPTAPSGLAGSWIGEVVDEGAGPGSASLEIVSVPLGLSGTWSFTFAEPATSTRGSLNGTVSGSAVTLAMTPGTPLPCGMFGSIGVTASLVGDRLSGTFVRLTCGGAESGTLDLRRGD